MAAQVAIDPNAAVPTVGASGAIAAVLGGYALLYPRARVITVVFIIIFFTIIELPALVVLGFWILTQIWLGTSELGQPVVSGGRRRVLRPHRRVRVRAAADQAVRQPRARGLRGGAPAAGLLMGRNVVLAGTLAIIVLLAGLTIAGAIDGGISVLGVLVTLIVLGLIGFGVLGALLSQPPDD